MASEGFHESVDNLRPETLERHRAIVSLMEELEAVDWYDQRVDATTDPDLQRVLAHNRDEEKEHAAMTLEWIRRHDAGFDEQLREWLFTDKVIGIDKAIGIDSDESEAADERDETARPDGSGSLSVGSLHGKGTL